MQLIGTAHGTVLRVKSARSTDANLTQERDGTWRVQVRLTLPDGKSFVREQRHVSGKEKARSVRDGFFAEFNAIALGNAIDRKRVKVVKSKTLEEWARECIETHWPNKRPVTAPKYAQQMTQHVLPVLGKVELSELDPVMIEKFIYDLRDKGKLAVSSLAYVKATLQSCLSMAVKQGLMASNPCSRLGISWKGMRQASGQEDQGVRLMTQEEINGFLDHAKDSPIYPMLLFQAKMGLRYAEALALTPKDFDVEKGIGARSCGVGARSCGILRVREQLQRRGKKGESVLKRVPLKTSESKRDIPIPQVVKDFLSTWEGKPDDPFTRTVGKRIEGNLKPKDDDGARIDVVGFMEPRRAQRLFTELVESYKDDEGKKVLDPPPTTHDLRGNFVSHLLNDKGIPATTVKSLAGHSNILTTLSYYSKASDKNLTEAMSMIG